MSISDDEKELFRATMRQVKPMHQASRVKLNKPKLIKSHSPSPEKLENPTWLLPRHEDDWLEAQDSLHFSKPGIQQRVLKRMQRGQAPIEARLDLHRCTAAEALQQLQRFKQRCLAHNLRWVIIVHGKGLSSAGKPVLKNLVNQWLRSQGDVLAFSSAQPKDGGTGAVYVLLKSGRGSYDG